MSENPAAATDASIEIVSPRGILRLRPEREEDHAFRFRLFCDARPDLALLPLPAAAREQLVTMQFRAQTMSYRAQFPAARFDIIELEESPIGRIAVDRPGAVIHIVDQALSPSFRNLGIGSAIMRALMGEAERAGLPLRLQVASDNAAALRLYLRLGFVPGGASGAFHTTLEWRARRAQA
jgi:ribosomal protein S18 acetylase RimI-like enzyme